MDQQLVVFRISDDLYGFDSDYVTEIVMTDNFRQQPDLTDEIHGFLNIHDEAIPVIDFRRKIGIYTKCHSEESWVMIVHADNQTVGLMVDGVVEMCQKDICEIRPMQSLLHTCHTRLIKGFGYLNGRKIALVCPNAIIQTVNLPVTAHAI